jgi:hypothetical protein
MLRDLHRRGLAPANIKRLLDTLRVMNEAAHGVDVDPEAAARAVEVGTAFLTELSERTRKDPE